VVDVGQNWVGDDFMDIGHLSISGGHKLAVAISEKVREMSGQYHGYTGIVPD
jgi:hypothetical protein